MNYVKKWLPKLNYSDGLNINCQLINLKQYTSLLSSLTLTMLLLTGVMLQMYMYSVYKIGQQEFLTSNYDWFTSVSSLLEQLGLQSILERRDYFNALIVYKGLNGLAPNYITTKFTRIRDCHGISTRSALDGNLTMPKLMLNVLNKHYVLLVLIHGTLSQLMFASLQACILLNDVTRLCTILNFSLNVFIICINCLTLCIIYLCFICLYTMYSYVPCFIRAPL